MTAPIFSILTQKELTIDLSRPAMQYIIAALEFDRAANIVIAGVRWTADIECEIDNFRNTLHNLMDRSEPKPENFDLIGE